MCHNHCRLALMVKSASAPAVRHQCTRSQLGVLETRAKAGGASCWQSSAACPAWWGGESPPPPWGKESTALSASNLLGELPSNGSPGLMLPGVPHARRALHSPNTVLRLRESGRSEARLCVHIVPRERAQVGAGTGIPLRYQLETDGCGQ